MLRISSGRGPRPTGGGFETFSWYFFRITGIALIFLVIAHFYIMHIGNDVGCTTYAFIASRYANPFWRLFDWLLLTLSLTHGMNGLRVVIDDYVRNPKVRLRLMSIAGIVLIIFFTLGTITLIAFQPVANVGAPCISH
jgi:succinate dehydrogenase / fumarate reductase membrane anchor subunit